MEARLDNNHTSGSTGQLSSVGNNGSTGRCDGGTFGRNGTLSGSTGSTGSGMHHSLSTPAGVDGGGLGVGGCTGSRTPPATPKKGGKMLAIRVQMLDDTVTIFQVQAKAMGRVLFDQVCKQLHLLEADYFGLEYQDQTSTRYWLDLQKPISRQLGLSMVDPLLYFCVKFYTPDPGQLEEEYTRYLFCLQVKRDLAQGFMQCNDNTASLMASYIVQAECGDYVSEDYPDHTYLSSYKFVPHQDHDMERRIMENHKKHAGQSPAEADLNLLETARRCELYGVKMHATKDHENVPLNLAVAHMGIVVFQQYTKINTFSWAKIRKISFKRKRFLIKLHPEGFGYYKDTVEFFFEGRNECKNFWKKCVENHGFFRCIAVKNSARHKTRVLSRGSSFRYSGKTQKQIVEFVRDNYVKRQTFQRSASFRHSHVHSHSAHNVHSSAVGNSISAHPLLPLADSSLSVEVSKLSDSLGAMAPAVAASGSKPPASSTAASAAGADRRATSALERDSRTTRSASRHPTTPTCWNSDLDTRPTTLPAQTMSSPSPPLTTQSVSPVTSMTTSPQHPLQGAPSSAEGAAYATPPYETRSSSSPVAVRAAVHKADTAATTPGTTPRTTTTTPHYYHPPPPLIHTTSTTSISSHHYHNSIPIPSTTRTPSNAHAHHPYDDDDDYRDSNTPPALPPRTLPLQTQSQNDLDYTNSVINDNAVLATTAAVPAAFSDADVDEDLRSSGEVASAYAPVPVKRHNWQRSASCRELYDFSFEDSGQAKRRVHPQQHHHHHSHNQPPPVPTRRGVSTTKYHPTASSSTTTSATSGVVTTTNSGYENTVRTLESPITRYDDHSALYSASTRNSCIEIQQDIVMPDQKVYSSSYPGTTSYSQESVEDPGNYELRDSQDDISHDSYELIERSDDEDESTSGGEYARYARIKTVNTRSCSLDSGNYIPSDSDSDKRFKCKSSTDVHLAADVFATDDPRDLPREIIPRRSDGSYYKALKQSSRTSSLESRSDYYESKASRSSKESLKKVQRRRSVGSRTSSQESAKSDYDNKLVLPKLDYDSRSSCESKSEYYDADADADAEEKGQIESAPPPPPPTKYAHEYDRKIHFERNYGTQKPPSTSVTIATTNHFRETHVHSVSLQNVETEQQIRNKRLANPEQNTLPRTQRQAQQHTRVDSDSGKVTHIWPEEIAGVDTQIKEWPASKQSTRSTESESNIFSFDEDKIQSYHESELQTESAFSSSSTRQNSNDSKSKNYRDIFNEIEPRKLDMITREPLAMHQPIERTKSDPNNLARQRINFNSRRMLLKHQKSIDLTPAESSDDDYLYKQIPSAPPIMKYRGPQFEMPSAEFGHFDILKREVEGQKSKFEVPVRQFQELGVKTQSDFTNLPPTDSEIPYVLHKRHIINSAERVKDDEKKWSSTGVQEVPCSPKEPPSKAPKSPVRTEIETTTTTTSISFLFTQNIDLSKLDPITLEVDKNVKPIQHLSSPKRDITRIDPVLLEALSSKLSQIESDSPTSSRTDSIKPLMKTKLLETTVEEPKIDDSKDVVTIKDLSDLKPKIIIRDKVKLDNKQKRIIKPRMQPGKKTGKTTKTKVRITSFSSDDESLDSDDVFGSAEATPTKIEFSPPQMRKEMESILKHESERKYLQYTMSSTEVEGSPPTSRKSDLLFDRTLDAAYQTELRRISERSLSIPSSEEEFNIKTADMQPVFENECADGLTTVEELDKEEYDKSVDDTIEQVTIQELIREEDLIAMDEQNQIEKQLLQDDIERDIRELQVPSRTRITEICSPSVRRKGHSPMMFAHARLNLSEGSAFSLLQKQNATESPLPGRRAKSLECPIIPINKLPPLNSFSSKDDTMDDEDPDQLSFGVCKESFTTETEEEIIQALANAPEYIDSSFETQDVTKMLVTEKSLENDQIVPDLSAKSKKSKKPETVKPITSKTKPVYKSSVSTKTGTKTIAKESKLAKPASPKKALTSKPPVKPTSLGKIVKNGVKIEMISDSKPASDSETKSQKQIQSQSSLALPEIKRTKSQEIESCKRPPPAEKARSLEKLEFKRTSSRERTKSQDESDTDIAKRKEKQQMLYEIAIKQSLKSPVKDTLPVFPQVEEMVRERHGKLEISINTIDTEVNLEEAIIITKSPKKLDKKMDKKMTKSLELNLTDDEELTSKSVQRLGKSLDIDIRNDSKSEELEFDFKSEAINNMQMERPGEASTKDTDTDTEETLQDTDLAQDNAILEGTTLDIWLTVEEEEKQKKLNNLTVLQKPKEFLEQTQSGLDTPDIKRLDTKSSSDSTSVERISLGNSLDIKFIDSSGDSSHKSEQDVQLIDELQQASKTVKKHIMRKLALRRRPPAPLPETVESPIISSPIDNALVRITSEEESLTEVSELKNQDANFLGVVSAHTKESLMKLSIERSRSESGSWMTVDCDEFVGTEESFESQVEELTPEKELNLVVELTKLSTRPDDSNLLSAHTKVNKIDLLKRSSDQSRSSDTTGSWTSGEKDSSPGKTGDESSVSCSIGKTIGLSQTIEKFATRDQLEKTSPDLELPRSPRSPRICVLGRAFTIDEGMEVPEAASRDIDVDDDSRLKRKPYPFEEKWSNDSELSQKLHEKLTKKLSSADKSSLSSMDESCSRRSNKNSFEKPSIHSVENVSIESRGSIDTESSSGSFGLMNRLPKSGDNKKELSSTWKPFPLESSGSSSVEDGLPADHDLYGQDFYLSRENSADTLTLTDVNRGVDLEATRTMDMMNNDMMVSFNYANLGLGSDIVVNTGFAPPGFLSRTLSRISERSTNSEKSSIDEDSTKASTQSSLHEDSLSSEARNSVSTNGGAAAAEPKKDPLPAAPIPKKEMPEHYANMSTLLQRQVSDDRRTSAEMADLSIDDIEIITSERGLKLRRQDSDDTIIDEESLTSERKEKRDSSSQDSDEWPLPDIPMQQRSLLQMHETPSTDTSQPTTQVFQPHTTIPKVFGLKNSLKSQESEQWPSPPSSVAEPMVVGNIETHYITPPEEACKVLVDSNTVSTYDNDSNSFSDTDNKTLEEIEDAEKTHTYENVATEHNSESVSESLSAGPSGVKIVLENRNNSESNSDELNVSNLNDDVFVDAVDTSRTSNELRPPTAMRRSTTSDESSHSGNRAELKIPSPKGSHSSYSDDDPTSSMGTNVEDGTVRYQYKPSKCTHSSHSEDTSIALSLSEWSNSTTTVKFQNLSTSKSATNSSGLKSDDNSLTDIAQSISEWSSSNSTLKAQSIQFQKMSSSTGDSSTLTEMIPALSEWTSGVDAAAKQFFAGPKPDRLSRMGSSIDESLMSPQVIPSEVCQPRPDTTSSASSGGVGSTYLKCTERPIMIPTTILSDNEKSTESSSMEQKTVHNLSRNDKKYGKLPTSKSADRQVKPPLKLSKCSPYYSSSLSSESTPMTTVTPPQLPAPVLPPPSQCASSSTGAINKTSSSSAHALTSSRSTHHHVVHHHRRPVSRSLFQARSPPSENDSTSSMESARTKSESRDRRGHHRRRRQTPQRRQKSDKDIPQHVKSEQYFQPDAEASQYNEYIRNRSMEELSRAYYTDKIVPSGSTRHTDDEDDDADQHDHEQVRPMEEGYYPDVDSQSGSDIFRMERDDDERYESAEGGGSSGGFDVSSIPPPLLEDDVDDFEADKSNI